MNPPELDAFLIWIMQADQGTRAVAVDKIGEVVCLHCGGLLAPPGSRCYCERDPGRE